MTVHYKWNWLLRVHFSVTVRGQNFVDLEVHYEWKTTVNQITETGACFHDNFRPNNWKNRKTILAGIKTYTIKSEIADKIIYWEHF